VFVAAVAVALLLLPIAWSVAVADRGAREPYGTGVLTERGAAIVNVDDRCASAGHVFRAFDGLHRFPDGTCALRTRGRLTCDAAFDSRATRKVGVDDNGRCRLVFRDGASIADLAAYEGRLTDAVVEDSRLYRALLAEHDTKVVTAANRQTAMMAAESDARSVQDAADAEMARAPPGYAADTGPLPDDESARHLCPLRCENDGGRVFTGDWHKSPDESHGYCKCAAPKSSPQPTVVMSGPETGGYTADATSWSVGSEPWRAFDRSPTTWWTSAEGMYEQDDGGRYVGVTHLSAGGAGKGEAVGFRMAAPVKPAFYTISPRADSSYALANTNPNWWTLLGLPADGGPAVPLDKRRGIAWASPDFKRFKVNAAAPACSTFVLVVHGVGNPGTRDHSAASVGDIVVYGA
jgi:hypothetical protein